MKPNIKKPSEINFDKVANREIERSTTLASEGKRKIPIENVIVVEGFNEGRDPEDFTEEALKELIESIIETKGPIKPIEVLLLADGKAILIDGERRYRSTLFAATRSKELKAQFSHIEAILAPKNSTALDRVIRMLLTQSQKHFAPIREAHLYKMLRDESNLSPSEIARKVAQSVQYVVDRLLLADTSEKEKDLIKSGRVKATTVVAMVKNGTNTETRIKTIEDKNSKGQPLKLKDVKQSELATYAHKIIELLQDVEKWPKLESQPLAWVQEAIAEARKILKVS